jgi:hypothetical protein
MEKIDLNLAKKMVDHYHNTRKKLIDRSHSINDTKSVWFPIKEFKDFVNQLPDHATGVRIHLAAYDHDIHHAPNQTTTVLTGTVANGTGHKDVIEDSNLLAVAGLAPANRGKSCPPECPTTT